MTLAPPFLWMTCAFASPRRFEVEPEGAYYLRRDDGSYTNW